MSNQRHIIRSVPEAEAELVRKFLAERGVARPTENTAAQRRRFAKRDRELEDYCRNGSWSAHRDSRQHLTANEALAGADDMTSSIKPAREDDWSNAKLVKRTLIPAKSVESPESVPAPETIMVAPVLVPGRCQYINCNKPLPRRRPANMKFCAGGACKQAAFRQRNAKIVGNIQFNDGLSREDAQVFQEYKTAARLMAESASRCQIDGARFIGTPGGVIVINDGPPLPSLEVLDLRGRILDPVVSVSASEHRSNDEDIAALARIADVVLDSSKRVRLIQFDSDESGIGHLRQREISCRFAGDPHRGWWDPPESDFLVWRELEAWEERRANKNYRQPIMESPPIGYARGFRN